MILRIKCEFLKEVLIFSDKPFYRFGILEQNDQCQNKMCRKEIADVQGLPAQDMERHTEHYAISAIFRNKKQEGCCYLIADHQPAYQDESPAGQPPRPVNE